MILLALSLLVTVQTRALPQPTSDVAVAVVAPATAPQGVLEPPIVPPITAVGASASPPEPPDPSVYPETTRMTRIARRMLATIALGSSVALLVHACPS
jgi:hypothetical protein